MSDMFGMVAAMSKTPSVEQACSEIKEERAAICEFDGLMTHEQAEAQGVLESEAYRQACEVRHVLGLALIERQEYLDRVEKVRGARAGGELREAVRKEWMRRKSA